MTRNGKIARLPKTVQEELNRRLQDNEPGKRLVAWLNSRPEVQAVITTEFGGKPIREQNLSEWKKGGYHDWQRRQERRELFQQLQAETGDLGTIMDDEAFSRQLSVLFKAEVALAAREVMAQTTDPRKRAEDLGMLAGKFAQLRREESNADRVRVVRERWARELAEREEHKRACGRLMPAHALLIQRMYIDMFSRGDALALELAAGPIPDTAPAPAQSD